MRHEPAAHVDGIARRLLMAAVEVHRHMGPGWPEATYEGALVIELDSRGIEYVRQPTYSTSYKGHVVGVCRPDLVVEKEVIVELKSVENLGEIHRMQAAGYLRQTGLTLALLVNFNTPVLLRGVRRIVRTERRPDIQPAVTGAAGP